MGTDRDDEHWGRSAGPQAPSPPGPEDATDFTPGSRHLSSARGNGLDLRPATAAGVPGGHASSSASQDASSTRQTDLGSLSAQLFAPRPQVCGVQLSNGVLHAAWHARQLLINCSRPCLVPAELVVSFVSDWAIDFVISSRQTKPGEHYRCMLKSCVMAL